MRLFVSTVALLFSMSVYAFGDYVDESNTNQQGQLQGQQQGQLQGQHQGQGQGQGQAQGIFHSGNAHQGQLQGNVGVNKAVGQGNTTTITSSGTIEAEPAIAPAIAPGDPTAPCYVTLGGSAAGGGVASIGFSGYKYDTICGAMEFYRVVGNDPAHADQAHKAVKVAYHNLMNRMWDEMGETEYTKATGDTVADAGTTASYSYPTQDGGFMKVSFEKLNQVGMDAEEVQAERDVTQPLR
jgi:hypothetical protein